MNRFDLTVLVVAFAFAPACSNVDRPESSTSQAQPLTPPPDAAPPPAPPAARATSAPAPARLALTSPTSGPSSASLALGDANERGTLRAIALAAASYAGVSSPTAIQAVASHDHQSAEYALSGAIIPDHAPVYVLKVHGKSPFTANHHPPGRPAPQGSVLTLTIDAQTHRVTDVGYVNNEPDFGKIGISTADLLVP